METVASAREIIIEVIESGDDLSKLTELIKQDKEVAFIIAHLCKTGQEGLYLHALAEINIHFRCISVNNMANVLNTLILHGRAMDAIDLINWILKNAPRRQVILGVSPIGYMINITEEFRFQYLSEICEVVRKFWDYRPYRFDVSPDFFRYLIYLSYDWNFEKYLEIMEDCYGFKEIVWNAYHTTTFRFWNILGKLELLSEN